MSVRPDAALAPAALAKRARNDFPPHTEAREGAAHWAIHVPRGPGEKRRRVTTWVPIRRRAGRAPEGGRDARAIYDRLAPLWEGAHPRWPVVAALHRGEITLDALHEAMSAQGVAGADRLLEAASAVAAAAAGDRDLVPLVEEWEGSALDRQRGSGVITARTRRNKVGQVLLLVAPEIAAWRRAVSLARRDGREAPAKPVVPAFPASAFTAQRIQQHLQDRYHGVPDARQVRELASRDPQVVQSTEAALRGQGDGAASAFVAFHLFSRWLVRRGVLTADPTASLRRPVRGRPKTHALRTQADVDLLAARLPEPLDDIWQVMAGTGLEPSVALALVADNYDLDSGAVIGMGTKHPSRERWVEPTRAARAALERAVATAGTRDGALWPGRDVHGRKIDRFLLADEIKRARDQLVREGHRQFRGITPYSGRHTFCVRMLRAGATSAEVAFQLGHRDARQVDSTYSLHTPPRGWLRRSERRAERRELRRERDRVAAAGGSPAARDGA